MGKLSKLIGDEVKQILDMSDAARMQRAKEMGFNTDNNYYHGTNSDFDEFDLGKGGQNFGDAASKEGVFLQSTPYGAEHYGENIKQVISKSKAKTVNAEDLLRDEYDYLKRRGEFDGEFDDFIEQVTEGDPYGYYETGQLFSDIKSAKKEGFEALEVDFGGISSKMAGRAQKFRVEFDPKNLRYPSAAFDPKKKDSGNLLAGALPVGAIGAASMLSPNESYAQTANKQALPRPDDVGSIKAPVHPRAAQMAGYFDKYNRAIEGTPLSLVLPEAPTDWANKLAYDGKTRIKDRIIAALGML